MLDGRWMVALPAEHPLAALKAVPVTALRGERLVLFARHLNPPLHDGLVAVLSGAGFAPEVAYRTAQVQLGPELVLQGIGLFVHASYVVRVPPPGVMTRPLAGFDNRLRLAAVWRGDRRTPAVRAYLEVLAKVTPPPTS